MKLLVACIGNIFLGDDGFGTEVAQRLAGRPLPAGVILRDFGIRGLDLIYALLEPYDLVILVDACRRGGEHGAVYLIEPDPVESNSPPQIETHGMDPMTVLRTVKQMGGPLNRILLVGCEPLDFGPDDEGRMGLSEPVAAAVDEAVRMVETVIAEHSLQLQ